jgi:hypothetical protein
LNAPRLNFALLLGTVFVLVASIVADWEIEPRVRDAYGPGDLNRLYLIAPAVHAFLAVLSLVTLPFCFRRKKIAEPILATALVLFISWMQIEGGVSRYHRYSSSTAATAGG